MPMEVGIALTFFHFFYNHRWHFATPSSHLVAQNAIFCDIFRFFNRYACIIQRYFVPLVSLKIC